MYEESYELYNKVKKLEKALGIRSTIKFNKIVGTVHSNSSLILVEYSNGHTIFYPHIVHIYPVGEVTIKVQDFLLDLAYLAHRDKMMRPGSMIDD